MRLRKEKLDIENLNEVIFISKKLLRIGLVMAVIALIAIVTFLLKEWHIFQIIKTFIVVISPVFIGLIIAWLFDPVVCYLQKKKIPRVIACILVYLVFIGGLILLISFMAPTFASQIKDFANAAPKILKDLKDVLTNFLDNMTNANGIDMEPVKVQIFNSLENFSLSLTTDLPDILINIMKSIVSGGMFLLLGIMIGFYMLYDFDKVNVGLLNLMPHKWRENAKELGTRINQSLRGYVQGVLMIMFLVFVTQSIGLTLAGLKAPLIFALFCAITDIIPYFGPWIGGIPAVIVGFTISPVVGVFTLVSILVVQLLENNFYQPLIMGHTMKLHPVTIMLGLLIFQHYFGIIGMIIATPVIASLKVIFTFIDEKIDVMKKIKNT